MTNDLEQLERAFEARAAQATISDDAETRIAARVRRARVQRRVTSTVSAAAVLAIVVAAAAMFHGSKPHVRVEAPDLPELTVTRFELATVPTGLTPSVGAVGTCTRVHRSAGKLVCDAPHVDADSSYSTDKDMNLREDVTTTTGGSPQPTFGTSNPRPITIRGHQGTISEVQASFGHYQLDWQETPNEHVSLMGPKTDSQAQLLHAADTLVARTMTVPLGVQTNTYHVRGIDATEIPGDGVGGVDIPFGVYANSGRICVGRIPASGNACSQPDLASAFAVSPDSGMPGDTDLTVAVFGTVKLDAAAVRVSFSDGTTQTSTVGGRDLELGTGFWVVPWNSKVRPTAAVALDAAGHELSRIDLHDGMFEPTPGFAPVATGVFDGRPWRIADGAPAQPCAEVQSSRDRGYFCGDEGGAPLAATEMLSTTDATTTIFARLRGAASQADIEEADGHLVHMRVVDAAGIGRIAVGETSSTGVVHVIARNADGDQVSIVEPDAAGAAVQQSHEILHGTSAHGAWRVMLGEPAFVTSPLADVIAGRRFDGTLCIAIGFGTPSVNSCIERGLFDQFLGNNGGAAATVGDPPVEFGVVPNTVPKVRVEMANGTNVEANTTPLEGVSGVNLWVTAVPDGVGVKKIDSLDATGKVIGTTQSIVPYSFIAPAP